MNEISIIGACKIGLLSICLFGTHKSTLALIIRGSSLSDDVPAIFGLVVLLWENTKLLACHQVPYRRYLGLYPVPAISLEVLGENMVPVYL